MGKIKDPSWDAAGVGPSLAPGRHRAQRQDRGRLGICREPQLCPAPAYSHTRFPLAVVCPALTAEVARKNAAGLLRPNSEFQRAGSAVSRRHPSQIPGRGSSWGLLLLGISHAPDGPTDPTDCGRRFQKCCVRPFPSVLITSLSSHVILTSKGISLLWDSPANLKTEVFSEHDPH